MPGSIPSVLKLIPTTSLYRRRKGVRRGSLHGCTSASALNLIRPFDLERTLRSADNKQALDDPRKPSVMERAGGGIHQHPDLALRASAQRKAQD